ncbi:MAG: accB [Chitinophagaceae bacterium]|nr:accB [Chitinophagaceae bacterium]
MDFKQIQELIKIVNKSNIGELSIEEKEFKITIKQKEEPVQNFLTSPQAPVYAQMPQPASSPAPASGANLAGNESQPAETKSNYITVKSPMIGTFYRRPSPDKPSFVEIGDEITPGKVVCVVEAMKLFNEIESEVSGKIIKILADDASPVEYDQPLFLVDPS